MIARMFTRDLLLQLAEYLCQPPPWHTNMGKRLVKSPRVYVRDSGLVHAFPSVNKLSQAPPPNF